jgi:hypothetical protein
MKAVKITYGKFNENVGLLQMVKDVKIDFQLGLKEAKDHIDRIRDEITRQTVILGEGCEQYNILMYLRDKGYLSLTTGEKMKVVSTEKSLPKRKVAKQDKEYAKALAWATSLHPKKVAMINLLIKDGYGI